MSERDAEQLLAALFRLDGARVTSQVALGGKRIDLLVEWRSVDGPDLLEAVEVKLSDWRRAVSQAYLNTAYVGRTYIALPTNPRRRIDENLLTGLGVGLIEFDDSSWRIVIEPTNHPTPDTIVAAVRAAIQ